MATPHHTHHTEVLVQAFMRDILTHLGPGLPVRVYREVLVQQLLLAGCWAWVHPTFPVQYRDVVIEDAFYGDVLVDGEVLVYIRSSRPAHLECCLSNWMRHAGLECAMWFDTSCPPDEKSFATLSYAEGYLETTNG